jgi:hypothetical protein
MMEWHVLPKERCLSLAAVVLCTLLLCGGPALALDANTAPGVARHKVISLQHITPERGRDFLTRLQIGTATRMPGTDSLLVTGDETELQKAQALLDLVDTRTEFDIRQLGPASPALPSNAEIAGAVGGVSIGTFAHPPKDKTKMRAIVDVHKGYVVAIAAAIQLQDIRLAVELGPHVLRERRAISQPASAAGAGTIQASAMLEASLSGQPKASLSPEEMAKMRQQIEEMRRHAAEMRTQREAEMQSGAGSASSAMSEGLPAGGDAPFGQTDANGVEPSLPAGFQHAGVTPDQSVPVAAEPAGLQPGQRVPSDSDRITEPKIEPKSILDRSQLAPWHRRNRRRPPRRRSMSPRVSPMETRF